jgi:hypothetical protein
MSVMLRTMLLLLAGGIAGAGAVYLLRVGADAVPAAPTDGVSRLEPAGSDPEAFATDAVLGFASARLAVYERAVGVTDPAELQGMIQKAAAESLPLIRAMKLRALLSRLAEVEPGRAVRVAQSLRLESRLLAPLYQAWAGIDTEAALADLSRLSRPAMQRTIALAVLDILGEGLDAVDRVARALPAADRLGFKLDALAARAASAPAKTLAMALSEDDPTTRWLIVSRLAVALVEADAHAALAQAALIDDEDLRRLYSVAVINALARDGHEAVVAFLETADLSALSGAPGALDILARNEPELMLALVDRLPPAARAGVQREALQALAYRDPAAALRGLESMPPDPSRGALLRVIAQAYGQQSPDAALAWAESVSPASAEAIGGVLAGIAASDFDRALDLLGGELSQWSASSGSELPSIVLPLMDAAGPEAGRVLDRLLEIGIDDRQTGAALHAAMSGWAQADREAAMEWALANADRIAAQTARMLALEDPESAMRSLDRVAADQRGGWIAGVAAGLARSDLDAAMSFVGTQRGQPGYEGGFDEVLRAWARVDPAHAAGLAAEAGGSASSLQSLPMVADAWAKVDPQAAGNWAFALSDRTLRANSISHVAAVWAVEDTAAAQRWLLGLPNGPARDAGLSSLLRAGAASGSVDTSLLGAYSSDAARQQGMANALVELGLSDPEEARRLMEIHVSDHRLRETVESMLAQSDEFGGFAPRIIF